VSRFGSKYFSNIHRTHRPKLPVLEKFITNLVRQLCSSGFRAGTAPLKLVFVNVWTAVSVKYDLGETDILEYVKPI
jgi:hypothetical protein